MMTEKPAWLWQRAKEMKDRFITLAIESSCDETAAAVSLNGRTVLSSVISSQIAIHEAYGGVVPEIASRNHLEKVNAVVDEAMEKAGITWDDVDLIGVTNGPGLIGALVVGVAAAKGYSLARNIPLVGVNHMHGHVASNLITYPDLEPPFVSLVVSGGHTNIVRMEDYSKFTVLGGTRDDAVGEAYDKVARVIGLGYPGGPKIDKLAKEGDPDAVDFPRANIADAPMDFSFSGLKSAVLNYLNSCGMQGTEINKADVAASFQKAVVDAITDRAIKMCEDKGITKLAIAGGVASNSYLRESLENECAKRNIKYYSPSVLMCTDNAAMIGSAAFYKYIKGETAGYDLNAVPGLGLTGTR